MSLQAPARALAPFDGKAAWEADTLRRDRSWVAELTDTHRAELSDALDHFKECARKQGDTAQWLHGFQTPGLEEFPLPTLGPELVRVRRALEEDYGLFLLRGFPLDDVAPKDRQLLHAGLAAHVGTPRPQTVFGERVQELRDVGQAALKERRGSKHNRALPFHNDPCDVVSFLCVQSAHTGGTGLFASSVAIHDALLRCAPDHVETLYEDLIHAYQEYLFVRTGWNRNLLPTARSYAMPTFSAEAGRFACKYSRFYVDAAQELPEVPRLTPRQIGALRALEEEMDAARFRLEHRYERGDVVFINNYVCFHARTAFGDDPGDATRRRHLQRIWLAVPNSRPLAPAWRRQVFFDRTEAGAPRGGVPVAETSDS